MFKFKSSRRIILVLLTVMMFLIAIPAGVGDTLVLADTIHTQYMETQEQANSEREPYLGESDISALNDLESLEISESIINEAMDLPLDPKGNERDGAVNNSENHFDLALSHESIRSSSDKEINSTTGTVTIQYRGNGHTSGIVPTNQLLTTPGSIALRPQGNLARTGHVFVGWRDSVGNIIPAGSTVGWSTAVSGILVLDAHWIPSVVTITYTGNGHTSGTVPANQTLTTPGSIAIRPQGNLARTGHVFVGWRTPAGEVIAAGSTISWNTVVAGTLTLDAHWIPSVVTITYSGNGHTNGTVPTNQTLTTPGTITLRPQGDLRRTGRVFIGWRDSTGSIFPPEASVSINAPAAGTINLDAHWVDWIWHQDVDATTGGNINRVGFWSGTGSINVHSHTLGTVSDGFVFHFRMLQAQQAWSNALDVPITSVTQAQNAHIRAYGGQRADIDEFLGGSSDWAGLAIYPTTAPQQNIIINDTTRNVLRFSGQGQMFVIERSTASTWTQNDIDATRKTTTHELGHSLGWMGHASRILADNTYVMWWQSSNHFNLKTNEIRHLKQIYDHFR